MKNRKLEVLVAVTALLVGMVVVSIYFNLQLISQNTKLEAALPYLTPGESPEYFDIISEDGKNVDLSRLQSGNSLIVIFKSPCSRCNKNIAVWNRIFDHVKDQCNVYGIITGDASDIHEVGAGTKFDLYYPADINRFRRAFRLRLNFAQTLVAKEGKIDLIRFGDISGEDFPTIIKTIKKPAQ
ncbi:MAG: hypothetical protein GY765_23555 [bacterium]|nr:hypothetical protein [bacterium]